VSAAGPSTPGLDFAPLCQRALIVEVSGVVNQLRTSASALDDTVLHAWPLLGKQAQAIALDRSALEQACASSGSSCCPKVTAPGATAQAPQPLLDCQQAYLWRPSHATQFPPRACGSPQLARMIQVARLQSAARLSASGLRLAQAGVGQRRSRNCRWPRPLKARGQVLPRRLLAQVSAARPCSPCRSVCRDQHACVPRGARAIV